MRWGWTPHQSRLGRSPSPRLWRREPIAGEHPARFAYRDGMNTTTLLIVLLVLLLLFGGGGFYFGGPAYGGGGLVLVLLICLVIYLMGGFRGRL
jgi:hypothetical protein